EAANPMGIETMEILHPSPASPAANKDWKGKATKKLVEAGVW
ncbi:MAG: single-stranded DNA-binding protein, partial [Verrucomicrobia bacterium]|nr:single-stranded DNA-binding protein [Verrucomicrobiota bacterium]